MARSREHPLGGVRRRTQEERARAICSRELLLKLDANHPRRQHPSGAIARPGFLRRQLSQDIGQNPAVAEIFQFIQRIDAASERNGQRFSVGAPDLSVQRLPGL
jgi:GAF domain-containing protein